MDSKTFLIPSLREEDIPIIQTEVEAIEGVRMVQVHQPTHSVTVTWTAPATWDDIGGRLAELKFMMDLPQDF